MDDESNDDLPMTIRIDPPYIRDIDEEEEEEWEAVKDSAKVNMNVIVMCAVRS